MKYCIIGPGYSSPSSEKDDNQGQQDGTDERDAEREIARAVDTQLEE